jgi:hypothetical protein
VLAVRYVAATARVGAPPTAVIARPPAMYIAPLTCAASPRRASTAAPIGALDAELTRKGYTGALANADGTKEYVTPITIDGQSASDVCLLELVMLMRAQTLRSCQSHPAPLLSIAALIALQPRLWLVGHT